MIGIFYWVKNVILKCAFIFPSLNELWSKFYVTVVINILVAVEEKVCVFSVQHYFNIYDIKR